ncbi:MAG: Maf family protein [Clostridia bacterium]|nr:Maf family protein [Clostridia bacterium]
MKKIILASSSPRRRDLLANAELKFDVCIKNVDETLPEGLAPAEAVEYIAKKKALAISAIAEDAIVIGADTVVVLDGKVMGKPKDKEHACQMLSALSGKEHEVITGVCLAYDDKAETFHCVSKVKFWELSDEEIKHYVTSGEPMDKAGAYGIQGKGSVLVERIEGDYFNIVGLPVSRVVREIRRIQKK